MRKFDALDIVMISILVVFGFFLVGTVIYGVYMETGPIPQFNQKCIALGGMPYNENSRSLWDQCWNEKAGTRIFIDGH